MRAGVHRLAAIVQAEFGADAADGTLFVFVSRDCHKAKLLRFCNNGWCLTYCHLTEGSLKWKGDHGGELVPVTGSQVAMMAEGYDPMRLPPASAHPGRAVL